MTTVSVWAPLANTSVELVAGDQSTVMDRESGGWWSTDAALAPGTRYAFRVDGGDERPDPRSLSQPDGPHDRSEVVDLEAHQWTHHNWHGTPLDGGVIYELHVGTFTPRGTLDAAIEHLDHLVDLGVTLVELMPVASFPGSRGWGYDGVSLYAVHAAYGGPRALQRFVNACHEKGLGVCLDVVYNHLGPSGNYLPVFGPYFTDRYQTPWGWAVNLDGPDSDEVRAYFLDNALMWFRDFHLDALRLDAVHALMDERATPFLEELAAAVQELSADVGRPLDLIAESDRNDPTTVMPRTFGRSSGYGMDAQWADDIHHALHSLLTGETQGYYADFADPKALRKVLSTPFFHDGTYSTFRRRVHGRAVDPTTTPGWRFIASLQTHDQVGNRACGDRNSHLLSVGRQACGAALLLTSCYTPMLFMGEEWGASTPWQYFTDHEDPELAAAVSIGRKAEFAEHGWSEIVPDPQDPQTAAASTLRWDEVTKEPHARLLAWYRELLWLRRETPDLRASQLGSTRVSTNDNLIEVGRGSYRVVLNLGSAERHVDLAGGRTVASFGARLDQATVQLPPDSVVIIGPNSTD